MTGDRVQVELGVGLEGGGECGEELAKVATGKPLRIVQDRSKRFRGSRTLPLI